MKIIPCAYTKATAPAPDDIVIYPSGEFGPMMFHYLHEGVDTRLIARENGFEIMWLDLFDDVDEIDPAMRAYDAGDIAKTIELWNPATPAGWKLVGVHDAEDGPCATFIRPIPPEPATAAAPRPLQGAAA